MLFKKDNLNIFFILLVAFLMYKIVDNHKYFLGQLAVLWAILSPFFWAFATAYILNPLMVALEKLDNRITRPISLIIVYILFVGILTLAITIVTPVIVKNITEIIERLPSYIEATEKWISRQVLDYDLLEQLGINTYIFNNLDSIFNGAVDFLNLTLTGVVASIIGITSGVAKMLLGLVISVYLLADKEKFIRGIKKNLYAFLGRENADKTVDFGNEVNSIFTNFFVGKLIDSTIIGILCFIGLSLLKVRFALLLSIVVGIFNMIPYFGPFIGAVPAIVITLFYSPIQALWVTLFIFGLQQFDGIILGPKILGDKVGVSPFYIILAIMIGGGFFGPMGMLMGVPVLKSFFVLWDKILVNLLKKKKIEAI